MSSTVESVLSYKVSGTDAGFEVFKLAYELRNLAKERNGKWSVDNRSWQFTKESFASEEEFENAKTYFESLNQDEMIKPESRAVHTNGSIELQYGETIFYGKEGYFFKGTHYRNKDALKEIGCRWNPKYSTWIVDASSKTRDELIELVNKMADANAVADENKTEPKREMKCSHCKNTGHRVTHCDIKLGDTIRDWILEYVRIAKESEAYNDSCRMNAKYCEKLAKTQEFLDIAVRHLKGLKEKTFENLIKVVYIPDIIPDDS